MPSEQGIEPEREHQRKGGIPWLWVFVVIGVIGIGLLIWPGSIFLSVLVSVAGIRVEEARLRKAEVYKPAAKALAVYCQSDQTLLPESLSYAWLPLELARLGPSYCNIRTNFAMVEMGGGFYHFGYRLTLDESASTRLTNIWKLELYREGSAKDEQLTTFALASTQRLVADDLVKIAASGFDEAIRKGNNGAYQGKVMLLLRFGRTSEAAETCKEWIRREPNSWLPRFSYAHVRCRLGEVEPASAEFSAWVQAHQNFAHCIYLALFGLREGRTNEALAGVRLALKQPFEEPYGTEGNKFYLGQNGALIRFLNGDYELCIAMCDKMFADSRQDKWWQRSILRVKASATLLKKDQGSARELMRQAVSSRVSGMFSEESQAKADEKLTSAIEKNDLAFVKNFENWTDEMEKWFSPFETDETGIHNAQNIPTPYPAHWKSDLMNPKTEY